MSTEQGWRKQLVVIFLARSALNTSYRIIYPFLPSLARGLGIPLTAASGLVTLRLVAGLAAPLAGHVADRYGRRRIMEGALLLYSVAGLLLGGVRNFPAAVVAFLLFGLAKVFYDPAVYAYVGDTVPYDRRGRMVGIIELSWSAAWLLGVPASGFLIERFGWQAPWLLFGALGLVSLGLTHHGLPAARPLIADGSDKAGPANPLRTWGMLLRRPPVVALLAASLLMTLTNEMVLIVYGAWLESSFRLSLGALGLASTVVGLADATAEMGTTVITDRLGKRRSVLVGLLGLAASLVLLPWLSTLGLAASLGGVVLMILAFEFGIVSLLPLVTELAPDARASLLSLNILAFSVGRTLGAGLGGWLWQWSAPRITLHAGLGVACSLLATMLIARGLTELQQQSQPAGGCSDS